MKKMILMGIVVGLAVSAVLYYWQHKDQQEPQALQIPVQPEKGMIPEENNEPAIRFPVEEVQPQVESQNAEDEPEQIKPLPPLDQSDNEMVDVLSGLFGQEALMKLFNVKDMIRHIVVTVDNLPRKQYAVKYLPAKPVAGRFMVTDKEDGSIFTNADNSRRYAPYVNLLESLDEKAAVAAYTRVYPLFQKAYEDLGYPSAYFNDRLVDVIDHLLDSPGVRGSIRLVQPNVLYEYADEKLEALSSGQKILIRMGDDNAVRVKEKLRKFRHELAAHARTN